MNKKILIFAALSGLCAVALGAFGAHKLKELLSPQMLSAFETGVRYQFYHTLALLFVALAANENKMLNRAATFFMTGIILFSGSIYGLALSSISGNTWIWLGPVTPIGGLCFMTGWIFLIIYAFKKQ
ncbi:MAG TPA: DUF423 domain-containing protein [Bacteroidia bacterium]|nr:DUF423 domain-containing protein [Bacteroidia bacterium]HOZ90882.1 DUF423 domain-containing protein [Bacteroidia bacterium]HQW16516.1 DUF423 domain-containing protein [Bacteroidia bacterium]HQW47918.1 DUF423 domain-containing protein [Bacteroidia bacterium]HQX70251.1 DUF423 domain-containing protein [Bacteroidia bacterium]